MTLRVVLHALSKIYTLEKRLKQKWPFARQGSQHADRFVAKGAQCPVELDTKDGDDVVDISGSSARGSCRTHGRMDE